MIVKEFFSRRMFVVFGRPSSVICQLFASSHISESEVVDILTYSNMVRIRFQT
jgi:hypothetical protein